MYRICHSSGLKASLADDLLHSYGVNALSFHTWQADFTLQVSSRPQTNRLALHQAGRDLPVVNQRYEPVNLDFFSRTLLGLLDGTHDHDHWYMP